MKTANQNFTFLRTEKFNINQSEFAQVLGIKRSQVGAYEEGRADVPVAVMQKLANHYNAVFNPIENLNISTICKVLLLSQN